MSLQDKYLKFKAFSVAYEIDLNRIALKLKIPKKYTWEEPLILNNPILSGIISESDVYGRHVMVFSFGSVVFINASDDEMRKFFEYLKSIGFELDLSNTELFSDDYEMRVDPDNKLEFTNEHVIIPEFHDFVPELVSTVIAKSVAMERTEVNVSKIMDTVDGMITSIEKGGLRLKYKKLVYMTGKISRHGYNTIVYIMILDKPDVTWTNSFAEEFYNKMSEAFELSDRFEILQRKNDLLNNIMTNFYSITNTFRGLFVEWIIVALIAFEIGLALFEFIRSIIK